MYKNLLRKIKCSIFFLSLKYYCVILIVVLLSVKAYSEPNLAGVLISKEIRPFIMMVEGFESSIDMPVCRIFLDKDGNPYSHDPKFTSLAPDQFTIMIAVGPQALSWLVENKWQGPSLYSMVLNPKRLIGDNNKFCGVSLNLSFISQQISIIQKTFPGIRRLGVLFDPDNNQKWFQTARTVAAFKGIVLEPLLVYDRKDIASMFKGKGPKVDAILFIPDSTVIFRTLIQHVIKSCVSYKIPTIGYNKFFHESGAALSFIVDYKGVGSQIADKVKEVLYKKKCTGEGPVYKVFLNSNVAETLGVKIGKKLPEIVEVY